MFLGAKRFDDEEARGVDDAKARRFTDEDARRVDGVGAC